jgi:hypothetical protein
MKLNIGLLTVLCLFWCVQAQAQTLAYSLSYAETAASFKAHFANVGAPGQRSNEQDLAMLRFTRKNEIYSVSAVGGSRSLLFSDEGTDLEIRTWGTTSGAAKAYATAVWREWRTTPTRGVSSDEGIYELSLDASNRFRRIGDAQKQGRAVLNPQGTKAAFLGEGGRSITIYTVPQWKLITTLDLVKLTKAHCPDCSTNSYGWLADGNRMFVEMDIDEDEDAGKVDHTGTYLLGGDGADLGLVPTDVGASQLAEDMHLKFVEGRFLGQLPDGRYLSLDYGVKLGQRELFLVIAGSGSKTQKEFPLHFSFGDCYISPSGKYLAYVEQRQTPDYRAESHLWVQDLDSGAQKELFATPPPNPPTSPEPNVTLNILGWISE